MKRLSISADHPTHISDTLCEEGSFTGRHLIRLAMSLLLVSLITFGCDDDDNGGGDSSGETSAGEASAGETPAGEDPAGEDPAGEDPAGEDPAGEDPAGEDPAGEDPAGEEPAGEDPAGEDPAGETPAGETPAGETPAGETPAGEMMGSVEYTPETLLSDLSPEAQTDFCEAFVARDVEANMSISEADRQEFKETSCMLGALLGGATDTASCELAYAECIAEFESVMVTVDSCLMEFADAFNTCSATVSEFEACEGATRSLFLDSILNLPLTQTCDDVGDPALFLIASRLPTTPPAECDTPALQMCID